MHVYAVILPFCQVLWSQMFKNISKVIIMIEVKICWSCAPVKRVHIHRPTQTDISTVTSVTNTLIHVLNDCRAKSFTIISVYWYSIHVFIFISNPKLCKKKSWSGPDGVIHPRSLLLVSLGERVMSLRHNVTQTYVGLSLRHTFSSWHLGHQFELIKS